MDSTSVKALPYCLIILESLKWVSKVKNNIFKSFLVSITKRERRRKEKTGNDEKNNTWVFI